MDAATLYVIVSMLDGRERIMDYPYKSVAECEAVLKMMRGRQVGDRPTRYSCERHIRISPAARTKD